MRTITFALGVVLLLAGTGCSDQDGPVGSPTTPSPPAAASSVQSIVVTGSTSLTRIGDTSQLTVVATLADGTSRDVTRDASCDIVPYSYSLAPYRVVRTTGCLLTAVALGKQEVEVTYPAANWWPAPPSSATTRVMARVVPDGGFVLHGRITRAGYPMRDTTVRLTTPSGERTSIVDDFGNYMFAPVAGDVILSGEHPDYASETRRLTVSADEVVDLDLQPTVAPGGIAGIYRLTFTPAPSCSMPAEARTRTYAAWIIEGRSVGRPEDLIVTVAGAEFVVWGNESGFTGTREGDTVRFTIASDIALDYVLIELIDLTKQLYYVGTATANVSEKEIDGWFDGSLQLVDRFSRVIYAECVAPDHRIRFTR